MPLDMLGNFIQETVSAPGTAATINLAGAVAGRVRFRDQLGNGASVFYFLDDGTQAEWGQGTLTHGSPDTLTRTVEGNTAGTTSRLNFTGTTRVYNAVPAERMVWLDNNGLLGGLSPADLRASAGATTIGSAVLTAADAAAALASLGAAALAGADFSGGVSIGDPANLLYLGGANERVWQWEAGATDQIWYDPAGEVHIKLDNGERFLLTTAGARFSGDLEVQGAGGVLAVNAAKAWVAFDATGVTILGSYGVASITDGGSGNQTLNLSAAMPNADYCYVATCRQGDSVGSVVVGRDGDTKTTTALQVRTVGFDANFRDAQLVCVAIFG